MLFFVTVYDLDAVVGLSPPNSIVGLNAVMVMPASPLSTFGPRKPGLPCNPRSPLSPCGPGGPCALSMPRHPVRTLLQTLLADQLLPVRLLVARGTQHSPKPIFEPVIQCLNPAGERRHIQVYETIAHRQRPIHLKLRRDGAFFQRIEPTKHLHNRVSPQLQRPDLVPPKSADFLAPVRK